MEADSCLAPVCSPLGTVRVMATLGTGFTPRWHTAAVRSGAHVTHAVRLYAFQQLPVCSRPAVASLALSS